MPRFWPRNAFMQSALPVFVHFIRPQIATYFIHSRLHIFKIVSILVAKFLELQKITRKNNDMFPVKCNLLEHAKSFDSSIANYCAHFSFSQIIQYSHRLIHGPNWTRVLFFLSSTFRVPSVRTSLLFLIFLPCYKCRRPSLIWLHYTHTTRTHMHGSRTHSHRQCAVHLWSRRHCHTHGVLSEMTLRHSFE